MNKFNFNYSGNIKLRLPKSLHEALVRKAESEGISLNQLCSYYLSSSISSNYLGTYEFDHRLEIIMNKTDEAKGDLNILFKELDELYYQVKVLLPSLKLELKNILANNKYSFDEQIEMLRNIYPIYSGAILNQNLPFFKIPSVRIVVNSNSSDYILNTAEMTSWLVPFKKDIVISNGDFDFFLPWKKRVYNVCDQLKPISIHLSCNYEDTKLLHDKIIETIKQKDVKNDYYISSKPCYNHANTSILFTQDELANLLI